MTIEWRQYRTVLLDMDGTVLDLAFDHYFWRELVPRCFARARRRSHGTARDEVFERYARVEGRLEWYCLDYWTDELGLDLKALKVASSQRIRFLPGARDFLAKPPVIEELVAAVERAAEIMPGARFILFTDADIAHSADCLRRHAS